MMHITYALWITLLFAYWIAKSTRFLVLSDVFIANDGPFIA